MHKYELPMRRSVPVKFRFAHNHHSNSKVRNYPFAGTATDPENATTTASSSMMLTTLAALVAITLATASVDASCRPNWGDNDLPLSARPLHDRNDANIICQQVLSLSQKLMATARKMIGSNHCSSCNYENCISNITDDSAALSYVIAINRQVRSGLQISVNLLNIPPPASV